jgi:hypothetical protein
VLFPALHKIMTPKQLDALGDKFEEEANRLFGEEGFEKTVDQVAEIEKELGIYELAKFTPTCCRRKIFSAAKRAVQGSVPIALVLASSLTEFSQETLG